MSIAPDLAKSLCEKSDQELIGILQNPADWMPEVADFARSELGRRSISTAQIDQKLAANTKHKAEELQKRSIEPLDILGNLLRGVGWRCPRVIWPSLFMASSIQVQKRRLSVKSQKVVADILACIWC
jgi:hypothetical protein